MTWIGTILTGLWDIVLCGGDKVTSGILLIATMVIMLLPSGKTGKNLSVALAQISHWIHLHCVLFAGVEYIHHTGSTRGFAMKTNIVKLEAGHGTTSRST